MRTIGVYEAKTHLARLLDEAASGESLVITKHGVPHAMLGPAKSKSQPVKKVVAALRAARKGLFLGDLSIRGMIDEGRR